MGREQLARRGEAAVLPPEGTTRLSGRELSRLEGCRFAGWPPRCPDRSTAEQQRGATAVPGMTRLRQRSLPRPRRQLKPRLHTSVAGPAVARAATCARLRCGAGVRDVHPCLLATLVGVAVVAGRGAPVSHSDRSAVYVRPAPDLHYLVTCAKARPDAGDNSTFTTPGRPGLPWRHRKQDPTREEVPQAMLNIWS